MDFNFPNFNFPLLLVLSVFVTGVVVLLDWLFWLPKRKEEATQLEITAGADADQPVKESAIVEMSKSVFPILLLVLVIRSFLFEPFQIPSGSMIPTLAVGDFILVSKYNYGLRLPVVGTKILPIGEPKRGDVMVFKQPGRENINFIKRVIGLPGDSVAYMGKRIAVNGQVVPEEFLAQLNDGRSIYRLYNEGAVGGQYQIRKELTSNDFRAEGEWVIPKGMYFVMGDNRDRSNDSRYWGFVPEQNVVGKAVYIWMHWPSWGEIPGFKNNGAIK